MIKNNLYKIVFRIPFLLFVIRAFFLVDWSQVFSYDKGLDIWSLVHILTGVGIWRCIKHVNIEHLQSLQNDIYGRIITKIEPIMPSEIQRIADMNELREAPELHFDMAFVLWAAYFREAVEHYLEYVPWFQQVVPGHELWFNRLILDPLMLVIGYLIAYFFPKLVIPAMLVCGGLVLYLTR